jgi:hypothetical protein
MTRRLNDDGTLKGNRGSGNGSAKLTESDIPIIRKRLQQGDSQVHIARDYNVSGSAIGLIHRGPNWNYIP